MLPRACRGSSVLVLIGAALACGSPSSGTEGLLIGTSGAANAGTGGGALFGGNGGSAGETKAPGAAGALLSVPKNTGGAIGGLGASASGTGGSGAAAGRMVTEDCASTKASAVDVTSVRPADIIFAIDSSKSMDLEIQFVREQMNAFSQQIVMSGIDVRVILLGERGAICMDAPLGSGSCPDDTNLPSYVHVPAEVGSNDALSVIVDSFPQWREHPRPAATKNFVVITDDNAKAPHLNGAGAFDAELGALDPMLFAEYTFNGVYCFTTCPEAFAVGQVYIDLVRDTNGVGGDLCEQNFEPVFDKLAQQIITTSGSTIACEWDLPPAPVGKAFSGELVDVERTTAAGTVPLARVATQADCQNGGWHFDSLLNPTKVLACPNTCMEMQNQPGGKIDLSFGCEAVGSCVASGAETVSNAAPGACDWTIPAPPAGQAIDYKSVNVRYTSASGFASNLGIVASQADCGSVQHGWYYDDPTNPQKIFSCPQTCDEVKLGGAAAKVEVLFGCETLPAPIR